MGKPNTGKTETIKKRALYVYLPSLELADEWKARAKTESMSISKFIVGRVMDSLNTEVDDDEGPSRLELLEQIHIKDETVKELEQENRMLRNLSDSLDTELKRYRSAPFLDDEFEGPRPFDPELIEILKSTTRPLTQNDILRKLNIKSTQTDLVNAISLQLEMFEQIGVVDCLGRKWRWRGS